MDIAETTRRDFQKRVDLRQDTRYSKFVASIGFEVVNIKTSSGSAFGYIKYLPFLPIGFLKIQRYKGELLKKQLIKIIRDKWIVRTVLEPVKDKNIDTIARQDYDPFLPTSTRVVRIGDSDYSQNIKRILKKKSTSVQENVVVEEFFGAWRTHSKIWTLSKDALTKLKKNFGDDCILWVEKEGDEIVGGVVCLIVDKWGYYFAAFVSKKGRQSGSGVRGVVGLIDELKKRGVRYLDFEGVYDQRFPKDSWKGFSEFKSRFGGVVINLPGCFGRWF